MEKIKVLEVGPGDFGKSGLSNAVWNWYKRFNYDKIAVDFLSHIMPDDKYIKYIEEHDGNFYYVGNKNSIIKSFKKFFCTRKIVKNNKYDCVHIHSSHAYGAFFHYIAVKPFCSNIIIHSHNTGIDHSSIIKYLLHKICRCLLNDKKLIKLACSSLAAEWMYANKSDCIIIKYGIDTSRFVFNKQIRDKIRTEIGVENKFVIGHIGVFKYQKNHDFLIDIFKKVHSDNNFAVLLLVGEGELLENIKEKVYNFGLNDAVIFLSTTPNINEIYQAIDCFVFPSNFEGFGIVAIEAQTAGLKTLCSDVVPNEARITDLLEYMSLSDSDEKWADKILSYNDGYERKNMYAKIIDAGYDVEQSAKQLEQLYFNNNMKPKSLKS